MSLPDSSKGRVYIPVHACAQKDHLCDGENHRPRQVLDCMALSSSVIMAAWLQRKEGIQGPLLGGISGAGAGALLAVPVHYIQGSSKHQQLLHPNDLNS